MQARLKTLIFRKSRDPLIAEMFAYSSKGVGGLNLIGFGKNSATLKEKLIFLCKESKIKIPFKKYVLCVENSDFLKDLDFEELRWVEQPLFLLLMQISQQIQIYNLSNCISSGKINMNFMLIHPHIDSEHWQKLRKDWSISQLTYIGEFIKAQNKTDDLEYISTLEILKDLSIQGNGFEQVRYGSQVK